MFKILIIEDNREKLKNILNVITSKCEIPEEFISKSEIWIGDILMRKSDNIKNILIKTIPSYTLDIDLKFANGLEINDIKVEVFGNCKTLTIWENINIQIKRIC